ncbi:MAG TPA: GAF domain-containing protein [Cyclobacteriaceae bacterium]
MNTISLLRKSAFAKVGIVTLLTLLFSLGALFYYLTYSSAKADNQSRLITAQLTSQSVLDKVDRNFYERFGDVQAFAFNRLAVQAVKHDTATMAEVQTFINTMTAYYVLYDLMMICDLNGNAVAVNTKDKNGNALNTKHFLSLNFQKEEWFKACTESAGPPGGAWYSDFMANAEIGKVYNTPGYGMAFAAPIRNDGGQILGVWYNYASWNEVTEGIRIEAENTLQKDHPGSLVILTKATGEVISATNTSFIRESLVIDSIAIQTKHNILYNNMPASKYLTGWANANGAYIYKGKHWGGVTLIPKTTVTWSLFFSGENFPAIVASLLVVIGIGYFVYHYFKKEIIKRIIFVRETQEKLSRGEMVHIEDSSINEDEIGQIIKTLSVLAENIKEKAAFADEIAKGNLQASLQDVDEKDILGNSLTNMRNQLKTSTEADKQRNWSAEGIGQIGVLLRSYQNSDDLYYSIISFLVKYVNANQGGIFLANENDETLELKACYAYEKRKFIAKTISVDEGLLGQCFKERGTIYITDIPQQYITITSGLGGSSPKSILIVPLKTADAIFGVMEIASFNVFNKHEIDFIEKISESIASSVGAVLVNERTKVMVAQLQEQTEMMKSQEEEMRQNMEELAATQEEMLRKEQEYLSRIAKLEGVEKEVMS